MSPEQAAGRPSFSSDLYSLGMTAIYLLTGRSPNEIPTSSQDSHILWQQYAPNVSDRFASILTRATQINPTHRYPSASAMLDFLETSPVASTLVSAPPISTSNTPDRQQVLPVQQPSANPLPWKPISIAIGTLALAAGAAGIVARSPITLNPDSQARQIVSAEERQSTIEELEERAAARPDDESNRLELANTYLQTGEYNNAIEQATTVLEQDANNAEALVVLGQGQIEVGEYDEAIATLTSAIEQDRKNVEALLKRGEAYAEVGQDGKAASDWYRVRDIDSDNVEAHLNLGLFSQTRHNYQKAQEGFDSAVKQAPNAIAPYFYRGNLYQQWEKLEEANADAEKILTLTPTSAEDYRMQGWAHKQLKQPLEEVDAYRKASQINPNSVNTYLELAKFLFEQGDVEASFEPIEAALLVNPNATEAIVLKADFKLFSNQPDPALYAPAIAINPNNARFYERRCHTYFFLKQLMNALEDCNKSIELAQNVPLTYRRRGDIYLLQENFEAALADYTQTIDLNKVQGTTKLSHDAFVRRGSIRSKLGNGKGAIDDLTQAIALEPSNANDYKLRGQFHYVANRDREKAIADLDKAIALYTEQDNFEKAETVKALRADLPQL